MDSKLYNKPAALEVRIQHYKAHVKKQATQIVALEGKVVDLEGKIAYLQDALAQERQRQPTVSLVTTSQPPGELQAASSGSNEPPHGALKQGDSPFKVSVPRETQRSVVHDTARPCSLPRLHTGRDHTPLRYPIRGVPTIPSYWTMKTTSLPPHLSRRVALPLMSRSVVFALLFVVRAVYREYSMCLIT